MLTLEEDLDPEITVSHVISKLHLLISDRSG